MAKENGNCALLKQEHIFRPDLERNLWVCSTRNCFENLTKEEMDGIVERTVPMETGHAMMIWPAQVDAWRKG